MYCVTQCGWGSTNLTIALQLLLRAALEEPCNQRFILLSESGVPLYPAVTIHQARMPSSMLNQLFLFREPGTQSKLVTELQAVVNGATIVLRTLCSAVMHRPVSACHRALHAHEGCLCTGSHFCTPQAMLGETRSKIDACLVNFNWWLPPPKVTSVCTRQLSLANRSNASCAGRVRASQMLRASWLSLQQSVGDQRGLPLQAVTSPMQLVLTYTPSEQTRRKPEHGGASCPGCAVSSTDAVAGLEAHILRCHHAGQ